MISVTEKAKERALELMAKESHPTESFIRVGVAGGGCSGLSYSLEFDHELKADDKLF
jgi:iron-sulfur cluster assembly protein